MEGGRAGTRGLTVISLYDSLVEPRGMGRCCILSAAGRRGKHQGTQPRVGLQRRGGRQSPKRLLACDAARNMLALPQST